MRKWLKHTHKKPQQLYGNFNKDDSDSQIIAIKAIIPITLKMCWGGAVLKNNQTKIRNLEEKKPHQIRRQTIVIT